MRIGVNSERGTSTQTLTGGLTLHIIDAYCAFIFRNSVMSRTYKVTATTSVSSRFRSNNKSKQKYQLPNSLLMFKQVNVE